MVAAVFCIDIVDDLLPPADAEVDVNIRHGNAVRIEKAFKQQAVAQRIDACDADTVRRKASCAGAAPRSNRDANRFCVIDKIGNNQIIIDIPHLCDDIQLIFQTLGNAPVRLFPVAAAQPLGAQPPEIRLIVLAIWRDKQREFCIAKFKFNIALFSDLQRVVKRARIISKQLVHLIAAFNIKFLCFKLKITGRVNSRVRLDTDQNTLHPRVGLFNIMRVVRRDKPNADFPSQTHQIRKDLLL